MNETDELAEDGWVQHRRDQLRREAEATPVQRLRWLEEAIAFAFRAGAIPRLVPLSTESSTSQPPVS